MIGPVPMDDPWNDPFPVGADRAAIVMWHERQRRQRQVRMMMMFMMMLLLMDGEEQGNARRRQYAARHGGRLRGGRGGRGRRGDNDIMADHLYRARIVQDGKIAQSARLDRRYGILQRLNDGKDVEQEVMDWVVQDMERREKEDADAEQDDEEETKNDSSNKTKKGRRNKTTKRQVAATSGSPDDSDSRAEDAEEAEEASNRMVHHYPRNVTGYYRGEWKRLGDGSDVKNGTLDASTPSGVKSSTAIERRDSVKVKDGTTSKNGKETKSTKKSNGDNDDDNDNDDDDGDTYIVDEVEIEAAVQTMMRDRGDRIGVYVLPSGMRLPKAYNVSGNATLSPTEEAANAIERAYNGQKGSVDRRTSLLRPSVNAGAGAGAGTKDKKKMTADKEENEEPTLSLSKSSGRAAFQLYARSIPAMSQLSLVEGFVKLYDGENSAFSTRRDLLMRVRGIVVHSIGKVSLVANTGRGRSAMVIRTDTERDTSGSIIPSSAEVAKDKMDDSGGTDHRRRLQEVVADLPNQPGEVVLDNIRDDVLNLFGDGKDLGELRPLLRHLSEEDFEDDMSITRDLDALYDGADYTDRSFDDLFIGERCRQRAEAISNFFNREPRRREPAPFRTASVISPHVTSFIRRWLGMEAADFSSGGIIPIQVEDRRWRRRLLEEFDNFSIPILARNSSVDDELAAEVDNRSEEEEEGAADVSESNQDVNSVLSNTTIDDRTSTSRRTKVNTDAAAMKTKTLTKRKKKKISAASAKKTSEEKRLKDSEIMYSKMTKNIQTHPFVPDDEDHSVEKTITPIDRRIPYREQLLEDNGGQCEFQLNLEIKQAELSVGEWRRMVERHIRKVRDLDPASRRRDEEMDSEEYEEKARKKKRAASARAAAETLRKKSATPSSSSRASSKKEKESMVMTLTGAIVSTECHFNSSINVTAIRTDWEHTTGKAINYSFYMMLTCLTQIVVLLRQLLHTQAQSAATRVSLISIAWQAVLDAVLCITHIFLCLVMQPLFTAFASVAFFKLLIFCVIEMKYMAIILQARDRASGEGNIGAEEMRRRIALLHLRFYSALMVAIFLFYYVGEKNRTLYMLVLYSFWVPQIVMNVVTEARRPMHKYYIYGMSITRLIAPLYMYGLPNNFLKEVNPDHPHNLIRCGLLVLWVAMQTAVLIGQDKYGARFMIPARFLPPKYNYYRAIPPSLLASMAQDVVENSANDKPGSSLSSPPRKSSSAPPTSQGLDPPNLTVEDAPLSPPPSEGVAPPSTGTGVARRTKRGKRPRSEMTNIKVTMQEEPTEVPENSCGALDCVICYNDIDLSKKKGYMLAPCDHLFHTDCLMQWMDIKMECPICRKELPPT